MTHGVSILCLIVTASLARADQFFTKNNTWVEKIPTDAKTMENSFHYVDDIILNGTRMDVNYQDPNVTRMEVNYQEWSVPVWKATGTQPTKVSTRGDTRPAEYGWDMVPIPPGARSAAADDGHMVVLSYDQKYEWDFYQARQNADKSWTATHIRRWDLDSDGINSPYDLRGSCRAAPVPLTHGLIMYAEIQKGYIDHALAFAYWGNRMPDPGVYPAEKDNGGISDRTWAMSLGYRLQLDPNLPLDSLGLNRAAKIIAKALQEYGMIFIENCGKNCNSVYAENLDGKSETWNGVLDTSIGNIPLKSFRVIEPVLPTSGKKNDTTPPASPQNLSVH